MAGPVEGLQAELFPRPGDQRAQKSGDATMSHPNDAARGRLRVRDDAKADGCAEVDDANAERAWRRIEVLVIVEHALAPAAHLRFVDDRVGRRRDADR